MRCLCRLDVGRTVFAAFHKAQLGMVAVVSGSLLGAWACADKDLRARLMLPSTLLWITTGCLAIQDIVLQPRLSARASMTLQGLPLPPSRLHLAYVGLEGCKAVMLMVAGWRLTGMGAAVSSDDSGATKRMTDAAVADTHVARGAISPTRIPDQQAQERPHGPQQRPDDQQQEQEPYGQGE